MMTPRDGSHVPGSAHGLNDKHVIGRGIAVGAILVAGIIAASAYLLPISHDSAVGRSTPTVEHVSGQITGDQSSLVVALSGSANPAMLLVLDSSVVSTCEDLARQLREALHVRSAASRRNVVVAPRGDSAFVRDWLTRERIGPIPIIATSDGVLRVGGRVIAAPAVLLADRTLRVSAGIVHLSRVTNTRPTSFAAELQLR